ncbi:MAG: hypothetical protein QOE66_311, partial [Chloroflexota bacterium]|nr:hypothetical protein [Chloroflexota bacterium]
MLVGQCHLSRGFDRRDLAIAGPQAGAGEHFNPPFGPPIVAAD